jgi:hypothetical protein
VKRSILAVLSAEVAVSSVPQWRGQVSALFSADSVDAELHRHTDADRMRCFRDRVFPGSLATPAHREQIAVTE